MFSIGSHFFVTLVLVSELHFSLLVAAYGSIKSWQNINSMEVTGHVQTFNYKVEKTSRIENGLVGKKVKSKTQHNAIFSTADIAFTKEL